MNLRVEPVTLEGAYVRLEPLSLAHLDGLCAVGLEPELWKWIPTAVRDREEMQAYVELALDERRRGVSMPFVTLLKADGQVVGSTRYGNVDLKNRRVEIGWTWIGKPWQRSAVNTEAKLLMLRHAFEVLGCLRVELKTDALNEKSRNAILRLGAKQEGIFRKHLLTYSGRMRDTVYFSILDAEWPAVRAGLEAKLAARA
jgi:RimJ/RimL family protein N-acetyltransferase